jgi:hypothetical protein
MRGEMRLIYLQLPILALCGCMTTDTQDSSSVNSLKADVDAVVDIKYDGALPPGWSRLDVKDADARSGVEKLVFNRNGNFLAGPDNLYIRLDRLPPGSAAFSTIRSRGKGRQLPGKNGTWNFFEDDKPKGRITFLGMYSRETATTGIIATAMQLNGKGTPDTKGVHSILSQL